MFNISYIATNPIVGDSPKFTNLTNDIEYKVKFINQNTKEINEQTCLPGQTIIGGKQYYIPWQIDVSVSSQLIYSEKINLKNKVIFIKFDAFALGDNIAWIPYVEEFRKKHDCHIICSTFHNNLFNQVYPNIMFVAPNTKIDNVYAQYYIGTHDIINTAYQPSNYLNNPLQKIASDILGLEFKEIKPKINIPNKKIEKLKKVCISPFASNRIKEWNVIGGWQTIINFLNSHGYEVVNISKEPCFYTNIINKCGNIPLENRIEDLLSCEFFIGVSSGLSWLAWALNIPVVLISDITPIYHEFQSNVIRINNGMRKEIIYKEIEYPSSTNEVINKVYSLLTNSTNCS